MNQRSWIWVGLFGGMAVALLSWLLLSDPEPTTAPPMASAHTSTDGAGPVGVDAKPQLKVRKLSLDPEMLRARSGALPGRIANNPAILQMRAKQPQHRIDAEDGPFNLDSDGIELAVTAHRAELVGCYETARLHTPELASSVVLSLGIEPGGDGRASVTSVEIDAEQDDAVLEECLASVFGEIAFSGSEATTVRYPVDLSR
ncbi:MAG TPA: hypothetical protein ENK18_27595 [Deltaproteobacteria bacterium]|nr:hypothetical protein [Deltaproteobacteria bacterium]